MDDEIFFGIGLSSMPRKKYALSGQQHQAQFGLNRALLMSCDLDLLLMMTLMTMIMSKTQGC